MAKLAEEGKVLADLSILDRQRGAELAARDRRMTLELERFELPEIEADAAHNGLGGQLHSPRLVSRMVHEGSLQVNSLRRGEIHALNKPL